MPKTLTLGQYPLIRLTEALKNRKFDNIDSFMEELKALKKLDAKKPKRS